MRSIEFQDHVQPNQALSTKDLDANFFQAIPCLEEMGRQHGCRFSILVSVHLEPMGACSRKVKSVADPAEGSRVAVSNDPTNEERALRVLEHAGLVKIGKPDMLLVTPGTLSRTQGS